MTYLFGQVIIGYRGTCEAIIDHTHLSTDRNGLDLLQSGDFRPKLDYHEILAFKVQTNACIDLIHAT